MLPNQLNEDFIKLIPKSKMLYKETKTTKYNQDMGYVLGSYDIT